MQDYSYIFVLGMVLTNTEITPHFHVIQNSAKMLPGSIRGEYIPNKSRMQHLFFESCLFRFASVKSALTTLSAT